MSVTATNKTLHSATMVSDKSLGAEPTWADAIYSWAVAFGTWASPYGFSNRTLNTATMTNKQLS